MAIGFNSASGTADGSSGMLQCSRIVANPNGIARASGSLRCSQRSWWVKFHSMCNSRLFAQGYRVSFGGDRLQHSRARELEISPSIDSVVELVVRRNGPRAVGRVNGCRVTMAPAAMTTSHWLSPSSPACQRDGCGAISINDIVSSFTDHLYTVWPRLQYDSPAVYPTTKFSLCSHQTAHVGFLMYDLAIAEDQNAGGLTRSSSR